MCLRASILVKRWIVLARTRDRGRRQRKYVAGERAVMSTHRGCAEQQRPLRVERLERARARALTA